MGATQSPKCVAGGATSCGGTRPNRAARRALRASGFTLIELLVSLTAGLVVALAVFALANVTTRTFQDETRVAATELSLRIAIDRLRSDVARAAYMSTGNFQADPKIADTPTSSRSVGSVGIRGLAGVSYLRNGSLPGTVENGINYSTTNGLSPDQLLLAGNFTSADDFLVRAVAPQGGQGGCTRIWLVGEAPAVWRVTAGAFADGGAADSQKAALRNVFQPVPSVNPANEQFIVRYTDDSGRSQFAPTCPVASAAGFANLDGVSPYVDIEGTLLTGQATGTVGGATGIGTGRATVNPVQWVRWEIASSGAVGAGSDASAGVNDRARFNLVRTFLNDKKVPVGTPEIITEYAVDLRFGFAVSQTISADAGTSTSLLVLPIGDPANDDWGFDPALSPIVNRGPQRIRSIHVRLATRTALPDRGGNIAAPTDYLYRYCIDAVSDLTNCRQFARVRTITTEIALPNQAGMFY